MTGEMTDRSYVAVGQRARQYRPETGHTVQQVFLHPPERTCLPAGTLATVRAVGTVGRDNPGCHTVWWTLGYAVHLLFRFPYPIQVAGRLRDGAKNATSAGWPRSRGPTGHPTPRCQRPMRCLWAMPSAASRSPA